MGYRHIFFDDLCRVATCLPAVVRFHDRDSRSGVLMIRRRMDFKNWREGIVVRSL